MPRRRYLFDSPDHFLAGTVGEPGNRTFFLQAREGSRITSVALEKIQVAAVCQRLTELLDQLEQRGVEGSEELDDMPGHIALDEPINEAFRVGHAVPRLGHRRGPGPDRGPRDHGRGDEDDVDAFGDDDDEDGPDLLRVRLTALRRPRVRGPCAAPDRVRAPAVPAVRPAAGPAGPPLPAAQRAPPELSPVDDPLEQDALQDEAADGDPADEDDGEPATSIDDLGLPMPVLAEDDALELLTGGELRIIGQLSVSSNNAMLGVVSRGRNRGRLHLQARRRRTAAPRLPGRHPRPAGGRVVRRVAGQRLGHRPAHRAP